MRSARAALIFLTRLPAGRLQDGDFALAPGWFGLVGLLVGFVQAGAFALGAAIWGAPLGALAAIAAGILITGALHEDGLADTFDGLGGGHDAERALTIMRDSRIGSYGALALGLVLAALALALIALGPAHAPAALIAGAALSRVGLAVMLRHGRYLRAHGAGTGLTGPQGMAGTLASLAAVLLALAIGSAVLGLSVWAGVAGCLLGAGIIWAWAQRRLGGVSGDILGAAQQFGMLGFVLGVGAWP
ncbi:MAG: cobalamin 5'-phosphate synthase CobS [Rhodobacteraceae bacterium HLUCCA12]|nr:MAG: cobalamin 5'-phosphate synthase CobS [Rhodobacteraceae bacterium HLUCCA12]